MLAQYRAIKRQHEDVILLFRLGDFYEMFGDDAKIASQVLELVLTSREVGKGRRIPMCGIPYHAADRYLARLLAAGHKAAICEQVEDPAKAKRLVKREVIRILTPGTVVEDHLLDANANNYLASIARVGARWGLAAADCSTGELTVTELSGPDCLEELLDEIARLRPAETLVGEHEDPQVIEAAGRYGLVTREDRAGSLTFGPAEYLMRHFRVASLRGFGCEEMPVAQEAAAGLIAYLGRTHKSGLEQIRSLRTYSRQEFMVVDAASRRNLELLASLRDGSRDNTLLWVLDHTATPMGGRLLRQWLTAPLLDVDAINQRLDTVEAFLADAGLRNRVRELLRGIRDLERPLGRAAAGVASGRDLAGLRDSLHKLPEFAAALASSRRRPLETLVGEFDPVADLCELLSRALAESPPATIREPGIIRVGYSPELDELRQASAQGKEWIAGLQERERQRTGIRSLRVGYNQVFGYYLEVTRPNLSQVPSDYQRRQTLANAERFVTPELKEYESKVLGAEERILALEQELFADLRHRTVAEAARIQRAAGVVAQADVLACLAEVAAENSYRRPAVTEDDRIEIRAGRHPVVEKTLTDERFVPNDANLDCSQDQILIITGPNMAGKSTYLRQVALTVLMAQMGSFVPAESASIGLVDRIFTRVGASDDLATGQSTFMVEMTETANILHHATRRSLVILDEIGRGTSTFDGLSIAWAVAEYLHNSPRLGAKTLFATHYHHLNDLAEELPRVRNYRIAVKEVGDQIVFLRQIVPGGTDRSYGIQVARLAGLPAEVIERAKQILWALEQSDRIAQGADAQGPPISPKPRREIPPAQLALFAGGPDPLLEELRNLDLNNLTPMQALAKLAELQRRAASRADAPREQPEQEDSED
jgi:DNA mismatch repair protein MutS